MRAELNYKKTTNYLHYKLGFTYHDCNSIIRNYGKRKNITYPADNNVYGYINLRMEALNNIGDVIQKNWQEFMTYYGSVKKYYKKEKNNHKKQAVVETVIEVN